MRLFYWLVIALVFKIIFYEPPNPLSERKIEEQKNASIAKQEIYDDLAEIEYYKALEKKRLANIYKTLAFKNGDTLILNKDSTFILYEYFDPFTSIAAQHHVEQGYWSKKNSLISLEVNKIRSGACVSHQYLPCDILAYNQEKEEWSKKKNTSSYKIQLSDNEQVRIKSSKKGYFLRTRPIYNH